MFLWNRLSESYPQHSKYPRYSFIHVLLWLVERVFIGSWPLFCPDSPWKLLWKIRTFECNYCVILWKNAIKTRGKYLARYSVIKPIIYALIYFIDSCQYQTKRLMYILPKIKCIPLYKVSYAELGNTFSLHSTMKRIGPLFPASTNNELNEFTKMHISIYKGIYEENGLQTS